MGNSLQQFEVVFGRFRKQIDMLKRVNAMANVTQSSAIKDEAILTKSQKKFREKLAPKLIEIKKFLAGGGTVVKGNIPGVSRTAPAWSCNQIMNALD